MNLQDFLVNHIKMFDRLKLNIITNPSSYTNIRDWNAVISNCSTFKECMWWLTYMQKTQVVRPNVYTCNKILQKTTDINDALSVLQEMIAKGISPDHWTFTILALHFSFSETQRLLTVMRCTPNAALLDVFATKAETIEQVYKVMDYFDNHKIEYSTHVWNQLLKVAPTKARRERYYTLMLQCGGRANEITKSILHTFNSAP